MSSTQNSLPVAQPPRLHASFDSTQTQHSPPSDTGRIIFTRQLWQRTMPDGTQSEQTVLNKSQTVNSQANHNNATGSSRRTSSTLSLRSRRRSPSPFDGSKTPLTPEESPPFRTTRKRSAAVLESEERVIDSSETSPAHTRNSSGDSAVHVCICQPDPKIPRPRNAFILYRQHHQANVVARNPGLANPEISKIIGEQWQNEAIEQKNKWKALAEEEKLRHQQQYPTYRYQPKRNGRRGSIDNSGSEKPKCQKCSGRMILAPAASYLTGQSSSLPPTPGSTVTPVTRTLPVFRDLSLESPAARHLRASYLSNNMLPKARVQMEERDDVGALSPENKRRRFNAEQPHLVQRSMPPRYGAAPAGMSIGPGTPFPFSQPPPTHVYSSAGGNVRRESLPGIRRVVSPQTAMAPPPRPGMGYQQHRLSQGHIHQDRTLTLPPLQTGYPMESVGTTGSGKTADEQIMTISFRYKVKVLSQVAPPAPRTADSPRGPLIAVEGDSSEAVAELAGWLMERLSKGEDLTVSLIDSPEVSSAGDKEKAMAQYHRLAAEWLGRSKSILESITLKPGSDRPEHASLTDTTRTATSPYSSRKAEAQHDDSDNASLQVKIGVVEQPDVEESLGDAADRTSRTFADTSQTDNMEVDTEHQRSSTTSMAPDAVSNASQLKPVTIIPNYSLHASNLFARLIPIGPNDPYAPNDHWQWTATLWRGIIGPDLTIYLRDASTGTTSGPSVEIEAVEGRPEVGLFVVKRVRPEGDDSETTSASAGGIDASVLRRVGFELSEWVRAFASVKE